MSKRTSFGDSSEVPMDVDEDPMKIAEKSAEDGCGVSNRPFAENVLDCTIKLGEEASSESVPETINVPMDVDKDPMKIAEKSAEGGCGVSNSSFAENVQHCTIKIKGRRSIENQDLESLLMRICAILNSGGGIVQIKSDTSPLDRIQLNVVWESFEDKMEDLVRPLTYHDVFDREFEGDKINLFIKAPNRICTVDYNLSLPGESKIGKTTYKKVEDLLSQKEISNQPQVPVRALRDDLLPKTFKFQDVLKFHETKQIQLKHYPDEKKLFTITGSKGHHRDKLKKHISAFGNGIGGVILIGVDDKSSRVHGQSMEEDSEAALEKRVEEIVNKMCKISEINPTRSVHWDIEFFPVVGRESNSVIAIYIAGMQNLGGIFTDCPKSFKLSKDGEIAPFEFNDWKDQMLREKCHDKSKGIKDARSKFATSYNSKDRRPLWIVGDSVEEIKNTFFAVGPECPVSPEGFERNLTATAQQVVTEIQEQCLGGLTGSLLVACRSWMSTCNKEVLSCSEEGVICDLLLFDQRKGGLHLLTLCSSESEVHFLEPYALNTAKALKNALVNQGDCHEKFYITSHVVPCCATTTVDVGPLLCHDSRYPTEYKLEFPKKKVDKILKALVIVLSQVPSMLSSKQGISFFNNILTVEQFGLLRRHMNWDRECWIKGAAGTGKTMVAVEFIKEIHRHYPNLTKENILYVCETFGLQEKIRKLDICQCISRNFFMTRSSFPDVQHVVLDEVQNYQSEDGNWLSQARKLVRQHLVEGKSGFLWLFIDNNQRWQEKPTGVPDVNDQQPSVHLTKVIRNAQTVFDFAIEYLGEQAQNDIEMGHDFVGEDVVIKSYPEGQQIETLREALDSLLREGYSERDIAVLFESEAAYYDRANLASDLNITQFFGSNCNDSDVVVITTFYNYTGLERPVVILVDIDKSSLDFNSNYYCAATRAMVKLVVLQSK